MSQLLLRRKPQDNQGGGTLQCPQCGGSKVKRIDSFGYALDVYRCFSLAIRMDRPHDAPRPCGVKFYYNVVPMGVFDTPSDARKKPELVMGQMPNAIPTGLARSLAQRSLARKTK